MNPELPKSRLAELRKKLKLTQEKFSEAIGVNKNTISAVETGTRLLNIDSAIKIAQEYDVTLDWLYGLKGAAEESNVLDSFSSFFCIGECSIELENKTNSNEKTFLTMCLSNVVKDYLLERSKMEKISKEINLPENVQTAWLDSIRSKYLKEMEEKKTETKVEYVLIEDDEKFGTDVAYARARRGLSDPAARVALDKLNFD